MSSTQYRIPANDDPYLNELENISQKQRHGLFTQPPPLNCGDKYDDALKSNGKQKAVLVNPSLKKNYEPALFQDPQYISLNDPYKESFKAKQIYDKEREMAIPHAKPFKPTDKDKKISQSEFEHMKEYEDRVIKRRTSEGQVRTESRNFLTNPAKKGFGNTTFGHLFSQPQYISDPYDNYNEQERKERIQHRSKFLHQNKGFVSTSHGLRPFTADRFVYDGSGYVKYQTFIFSQQKQMNLAYYTGSSAFRPSNPNKRGFMGCFERMTYMEEGGDNPKNKQIFQQKMSKTQTFERPWRPNSNGTFARPQPSISSKLQNINRCKTPNRL